MSNFREHKFAPALIGLLVIAFSLFLLFSRDRDSKQKQTNSGTISTVELKEDGFSPKEITIQAGDTVRFVTTRGKPFWPASNLHPTHEIYPEFDPKEPVNPGQSWSFRFDKAGTWQYHDHLAPLYRGVIIVENKSKVSPESYLTRYADEAMARCATAKYRPGCYDKEIPKITASLSMEEAFKVLRIVQEKDGQYWYCHVVSHELAQQETKKDLNKWKDVVARCPVSMCSNGCIHGAFQERFRSEELAPNQLEAFEDEVADVCEKKEDWSENGQEKFSCYHALGHLLIYATGADIAQSTRICEGIGNRNQRPNFIQSCYDGAFMQIFQPLEPEDEALVAKIKPTKEGLPAFCEKYGREGSRLASCWSEGWPLYFKKITDPKPAADFCNLLPEGSGRKRCYAGIFFAMAVHVNFDQKKMVDFCNNIYSEAQSDCFSTSAFRLISTDNRLSKESVSLCEQSLSSKVREGCFSNLLLKVQFVFHPHSRELGVFCDSLPGSWSTRCRDLSSEDW